MSDFTDYSPDVRWYVAHTYAGYENKVKANLEKIIANRGLQDVIQDVKIPVDITVENEGQENEKVVETKKFPSYVFVKMIMSDETWHVVRNIRGVTGFVGPGSKPVPLSDEEVAQNSLTDDVENESDQKVISLNFNVGDNVKIINGAVSGWVGVVEKISDDKTKISVKTSMFGRETTVELDASDVEVVDN